MKRLICQSTVLLGLGIAGCAAPSGALPGRAADSMKRPTIAAAQLTAAGRANDSQTTITAVAYQDDAASGENRPMPLEAVAPPTSPGPAPQATGNVFLPVPEIPPAPAASWQRASTSTDAEPMTLVELEAIACESNPTLLQARAQVQGTLGKAIQAGLWPNPRVIYQAEQIGLSDTAGEFQGALVRQRIVTAHKLDLSREKFLARARTAEWVALAQQYRVLNDLRIHYFRARGRQELIDVHRQLLKNAEDEVVTFRELYNVGQATRAEVHQVNVRLQRQRLDLLMAENDFQQSAEVLASLADLPRTPVALETPLAGQLALIEWEEALQRLLRESPELAAARSKLEADRITIRREIAEPVPDLIVQGGVGRNLVDHQTVGAASVTMEVPVFDWNQGTIRQAEADYARQQGEVRRIELFLRQQLATEYRNYLTAVQSVRNFEEVILPEARTAYDLRLESYEADRIPWTDVLQAERDYFMHRAQYINSLITWRESEVRILGFLLHGGLSTPPDPAPPGHIDAVPQPR